MTLYPMKPSGYITVKAPAKLNLFLEIGDKMDDGYHNIQSVMQSVTLYDTLTVIKTENDILLECDNADLVHETNIVVSAEKLFFEKSGIAGGALIRLKKRIPVSAGLGGGSSDAAATLNALNKLYGAPFKAEELSAIGKTLGADIPFCLKRGLCIAAGIGEILEDIGKIPECFFVISKGVGTVITGAAYEKLDLKKDRKRITPDSMLKAVKYGDIGAICDSLYNGFEQNEEYDAEIKEIMKNNGAKGTLMTGSGPSVFGVFIDEKDARAACKALKARGYTGFVCRPE